MRALSAKEVHSPFAAYLAADARFVFGTDVRDYYASIDHARLLDRLVRALPRAMQQRPVFYRRFMDDVIVLAATRHRLKAAIRTVNATLSRLGLAKAPEKTSIGRVERGFYFLGYGVARAGAALPPAPPDPRPATSASPAPEWPAAL